jgi:hypothetical protein
VDQALPLRTLSSNLLRRRSPLATLGPCVRCRYGQPALVSWATGHISRTRGNRNVVPLADATCWRCGPSATERCRDPGGPPTPPSPARSRPRPRRPAARTPRVPRIPPTLAPRATARRPVPSTWASASGYSTPRPPQRVGRTRDVCVQRHTRLLAMRSVSVLHCICADWS